MDINVYTQWSTCPQLPGWIERNSEVEQVLNSDAQKFSENGHSL